ncbi:MAG: RHS repeat protein, partial [Caulobacteraceae bacterium]|nr:RHS repeat protein [Caulobacteraceae bacterium]
ITKTAPSEAAVTYAYDLAGRLTGVTDASSAIHAVSTQGSYAASYSYDAMNRMITASWTPAATQTPPSAGTVTFRACNWMNIRRLCLKRVVRVLASDPYRPQTTWARARRSETSCAAFLTEPKSGSL